MGDMASNIYPSLFYRDAHGAITWLEKAFGFETLMKVPGEDGAVAHSELRFGNAIVMVASSNDARGAKSPLDLAGAHGGLYLTMPRNALEEHYERAKASGAQITRPLEDGKDYDGRGYSAKDIEGHDWSFGSYVPGT